MARSFYQDFTKDDGLPVTVEYTFNAGSETTYSPASGAHGGDPCEVTIVRSWPNTPEHDDLCARRNALSEAQQRNPFRVDDDERQVLWEMNNDIERDEARAELTDAERDRMEAWLCEHHVDEPDDDIDF